MVVQRIFIRYNVDRLFPVVSQYGNIISSIKHKSIDTSVLRKELLAETLDHQVISFYNLGKPTGIR